MSVGGQCSIFGGVADQTDRAPADNDNGWRLGRVAASDSQSALQLTLSGDSYNACWITSNTTAATQQLWASFCKQRQPQLTGTYDFYSPTSGRETIKRKY